MMLLLIVGGKLWAQTTIFSISDVSVTEKVSVASKQAHTVTSSEVTIDGGTVELFNGKGSAADMLTTSGQITIAGSGASYIHVSLTDNTIAEGDVIAFGAATGSGYIAKISTKPSSTITIGEGGMKCLKVLN